MRLISICPSNTELVAYLGLTDQLVGIDDFSDWPESTQNLPKLGPDLSIDMDALQQLQPDLVLASLSVPGMEKNITALQQRNIPHILFNGNSLEEIIEDLLILGQACHVDELAREIATEYRNFITTMHEIAATIKQKPSYYWEWWPNPIFTPGHINWLTEISELAGGINTFSDVNLASVMTDAQDVRQRNPDMIFLSWVGVPYERINTAVVLKRVGWSDITAVQNNAIYKMEEWLYCRPSPRLLEGALKLAKQVHPEAYKHVVLPSFIIKQQ
ncbi:cobalamin-binding protein [Kurthia sibirica]|uniref:Cobalamin-binding protein n=1 Tax=Kurthia sibirica TaxID=202750 RepID=A0A2U3ANV8_9BACL|nr:cobalamin-binding protein [Kurthia sibirica]PWI26233.1 cobalamin-binding protein [Kurthia sibirica]GEK33845.1 cobalamin-binding protein [Kurthia sibirica]